MSNLFERATRQKLRFSHKNSRITTEDLWDLSLPDLDAVAKKLNKELKESSEESFIKPVSTSNTKKKLEFDVVKYVIDYKLEQNKLAELRAEKRAKREKIMELIDQKENEALSQKGLDELRKELQELED